MLVFPNAKINIGLNIVARRADGYHDIESCFYPVGWSDALEITTADHLHFAAEGIAIPGDGADNLCLAAYRLLAADYPLTPVQINLLKTIPVGAGLGGGSSDAAFTIRLLNDFFNLKISFEKQLDYARRLGSDCAFFIRNKPVYCFGKGDQFEDVSLNLAGKSIIMVNPGIHISSGEAYSGTVPQHSDTDLRKALKEPVAAWKDLIKNDFEATLFPKYPLLEEIKQSLYHLGAEYASMSGSGSTIYGIFDSEKELKNNFGEYKIWQGFLG